MKRLISSLCCGAIAISAMADIETHTYLTTDFPADLSAGLSPLGWTSSGRDDKVAGSFANQFQDYSADNAFALLEYQSMTGMFSPSQFESGEASDQWLITPEFTITDDEAVLNFTVGVTGNNLNNSFHIYISESGNDRDSFYEIYSGTLVGKGDLLVSERHSISLPGYEGRNVHLAFVNSGNKEGMMGFADIQAAPYYINITNAESYGTYIFTDASRKMAMSLALITPVNTNGFTAKLSLSNRFETEYVSKLKFNSSRIVEDSFVFPEDVVIGDRERLDYSITVTPNYKNAPSTVITGKIMSADMLYNAAVLMEEFTGSWCTNCPYGYSIMNYFVDKFDGSDNGPKAIGVAIHNGDPMSVRYIDSGMVALSEPLGGFGGLPNMMVNRKKNMHPAYSIEYINDLLKQKTFVTTDITEVDYDAEKRTGVVKFDLKAGFTTDNTGFKALLIVTENNMSGTGKDWCQVNGLYGLTPKDIERDFGKEFVPYFDIFVGENSSNPVRNISYPDVARDYFPSLEGTPIVGGVEYDVPVQHTLDFSFTENVTNVEEAVVNVVILDSFGKVLTADSAKYSSFKGSSVNEVGENGITVKAADGMIYVSTECDGEATVYSPDGRVLARSLLKAGTTGISGVEGMAIVKVNAGDNSKSVKLIAR